MIKNKPLLHNGIVSHQLRGWTIKLGLRLQQLKKPGVYPIVLIVKDDGTHEIIVGGCKQEYLGQ